MKSKKKKKKIGNGKICIRNKLTLIKVEELIRNRPHYLARRDANVERGVIKQQKSSNEVLRPQKREKFAYLFVTLYFP